MSQSKDSRPRSVLDEIENTAEDRDRRLRNLLHEVEDSRASAEESADRIEKSTRSIKTASMVIFVEVALLLIISAFALGFLLGQASLS